MHIAPVFLKMSFMIRAYSLLPGKATVQRGGCNVDAMQTHDARVFLKMSFMTRTYS